MKTVLNWFKGKPFAVIQESRGVVEIRCDPGCGSVVAYRLLEALKEARIDMRGVEIDNDIMACKVLVSGLTPEKLFR